MLFKIESLVFIVLLIFINACSGEKKSRHLFNIQGEIKDCKECEGTEVKFIFNNLSNSYAQDIGKTTVKNGKFSFSQQIKQPGIYNVIYTDIGSNTIFHANLYLPADTVQIVFDKNRKRPKFYETPIA